MITTGHWSASAPVRLRDYHVEFALPGRGALPTAFLDACREAVAPDQIDWKYLLGNASIWKNVDFSEPTSYGTWHINRDPRDQSSNVEVAACCMGGEGVAVAGPWGAYPYTKAHAWLHAGIIARVCALKKIDTGGSFDAEAYGFQNGPLHNVSTHGLRALQTPDQDANLRPTFGYFIYSGDPDSRYDLGALDETDAPALATPDGARSKCIESAGWIRAQAHGIKAAGISDWWGLDKPAT